MRFEYVLSAIGGMGKLHVTERNKPILNWQIADMAASCDDFSCGLLFNAMMEESHGQKISELDVPTYADSGGLQLAILNLAPEKVDEKKAKIYETQGKFADYAFIFDEMPIRVQPTSGNANRVNNSNRIFVDTLVEPAALKTAQNVKQQIEHFKRMEVETKLFIIGQGRNFETFNQYFETIITHLTDEELTYIRGIAPSDTCFGLGTMERWDLMYQIKEYNIPESIKKNVHLLGVGRATGFAPVLLSPEYFNFIDVLSFDSTSDSRQYSMDGFIRPGLRMPQNDVRAMRVEYEALYAEIAPFLAHLGVADELEFMENMTFLSTKNVDKVWSYFTKEEKYREATSVMYMHIIGKFVKKSIDMISHEKYDTKMIYPIRDYKDFMQYRKWIEREYSLTSKKVRDVSAMEQYNYITELNQSFQNLF